MGQNKENFGAMFLPDSTARLQLPRAAARNTHRLVLQCHFIFDTFRIKVCVDFSQLTENLLLQLKQF